MNKELKPDCSILIFNFNESESCITTIKNLLENPISKKFNILVADDGSSDTKINELVEICRKHKIEFITGKNLGTFGNLCRAIKKIETNFITFQSSTDILDVQTTLELLRIKKLKELNVVIFPFLESKQEIEFNSYSTRHITPKCTGIKFLDKYILNKFNIGSTGGGIYPVKPLKRVLEQAEISDRYLMEDWICNFLLSQENIRFLQINRINYKYIQQLNNLGITTNKINLKYEIAKTQELIAKLSGKKKFKVSRMRDRIFEVIYVLSERRIISTVHSWILR